MTTKERLQQLIYAIIDPFVRLLIKIGFTPNGVTTIGFLLNVGVAVIFIAGGEEGNRGDLSYVGWAGGLILFAGLFRYAGWTGGPYRWHEFYIRRTI